MKERITFEKEISALLSLGPPILRELPAGAPADEVEQALKAKLWGKALDAAIEVGQHDETELTNLIFFAQNPLLPRAPLDRKAKDFAKLSRQWNAIRLKEVRPALQRASRDFELEVPGSLVAERDPLFAGTKGKQFQELVRWVSAEVDLNPGFLAAVLLAEVTSSEPYLNPDKVSSFFTGADDFLAKSKQVAENVPAFNKVRFDPKKTTVNINEEGRRVTSIRFDSGRDAALATAVYLKHGEIKLRNAARANGKDFDAFPVQVRFGLTRIAMAAGHGGIELNGTFRWFVGKRPKLKQVAKGTKGAHLVGVAIWLDRVLKGQDRVLKGKDIFVRGWGPRKFPDTFKITSRNATILVSQALHLSDWFFGIPLVFKPKKPVRPW